MSYLAFGFATLVVVILPVRAWDRGRRGCPPAPNGQYLTETGALAGLLLLLLDRDGISLSAIGLRFAGLTLTVFHATIGTIVVLAPEVVAILLRSLGPGRMQYVPVAHSALATRGRAALQVVLVCIVGAFWEELSFRGVGIYLAPPGPIGAVTAISLSSLVFGLQHLRAGVLAVCFTTYCGVIFCILYLATADLPAVMLAHALGNLAVIFYFSPRAGMDLK